MLEVGDHSVLYSLLSMFQSCSNKCMYGSSMLLVSDVRIK